MTNAIVHPDMLPLEGRALYAAAPGRGRIAALREYFDAQGLTALSYNAYEFDAFMKTDLMELADVLIIEGLSGASPLQRDHLIEFLESGVLNGKRMDRVRLIVGVDSGVGFIDGSLLRHFAS